MAGVTKIDPNTAHLFQQIAPISRDQEWTILLKKIDDMAARWNVTNSECTENRLLKKMNDLLTVDKLPQSATRDIMRNCYLETAVSLKVLSNCLIAKTAMTAHAPARLTLSEIYARNEELRKLAEENASFRTKIGSLEFDYAKQRKFYEKMEGQLKALHAENVRLATENMLLKQGELEYRGTIETVNTHLDLAHQEITKLNLQLKEAREALKIKSQNLQSLSKSPKVASSQSSSSSQIEPVTAYRLHTSVEGAAIATSPKAKLAMDSMLSSLKGEIGGPDATSLKSNLAMNSMLTSLKQEMGAGFKAPTLATPASAATPASGGRLHIITEEDETQTTPEVANTALETAWTPKSSTKGAITVTLERFLE